jgi:beta-N-acetylhexosaminidase
MKLGQLVICGISGKTLTQEEKDWIQEKSLGGVILFAHNYESPEQVAILVNEIQALRDDYPLFISIDQEGGRVQRLKAPFSIIPSMKDVALLDSPKTVYDLHSIIAYELAACGINLNFSPCCDVLTNPANNVIGDRAFGTTWQEVDKYVSAAMRGLMTHHVLPCAKHFPGHGGTLLDSHFDLPRVETSLDSLIENELKPFVKASRSRAEFIMMAHLVVDAIDATQPCTVSKKAYDFLRDQLKFKNIIITDDLEMKAIADNYKIEDILTLAFNAGADMAIFRTMDQARLALDGLEKSYKLKRIDKKEFEQKIDKILKCKAEHFGSYQPLYIPNLVEVFGNKANHKAISDIREQISQKKNS